MNEETIEVLKYLKREVDEHVRELRRVNAQSPTEYGRGRGDGMAFIGRLLDAELKKGEGMSEQEENPLDVLGRTIARLTEENASLRALDRELRKISNAQDGEETAAAMGRTAKERSDAWFAIVAERDAELSSLRAERDRLADGHRRMYEYLSDAGEADLCEMCRTVVLDDDEQYTGADADTDEVFIYCASCYEEHATALTAEGAVTPEEGK